MKFYQEPLEYGLAEVMALQPKQYFHADYSVNTNTGDVAFNPDSVTNDIGLVAQEVYNVIPEAVSKPADEQKEIWKLSYSKLVAVLVKAVQEQQEQIQTQQEEIEALRRRLDAVEENQ